jgi:hypothetical protein
LYKIKQRKEICVNNVLTTHILSSSSSSSYNNNKINNNNRLATRLWVKFRL